MHVYTYKDSYAILFTFRCICTCTHYIQMHMYLHTHIHTYTPTHMNTKHSIISRDYLFGRETSLDLRWRARNAEVLR
jgi:hypothetical protein